MDTINQLLEYEAFRRIDALEQAQELLERLLGVREVTEPLEADETETTEVIE